MQLTPSPGYLIAICDDLLEAAFVILAAQVASRRSPPRPSSPAASPSPKGRELTDSLTLHAARGCLLAGGYKPNETIHCNLSNLTNPRFEPIDLTCIE